MMRACAPPIWGPEWKLTDVADTRQTTFYSDVGNYWGRESKFSFNLPSEEDIAQL